MPSITVRKPAGRIAALLTLPRSKSVAARAAIISSMALPAGPRRVDEPFEVELTHYPDAEDSVILRRLLNERPEVMHCGMGGTTLRFLLAWAAIREGEEHLLTGEPRLLERPHMQLVEALRSLGADIEVRADGYRVRGKKLEGGVVRFDSPVSSQYVSAVMMIGPMLPNGLELYWVGKRLSEPYVMMTATLMAHYEGHWSIGPDPSSPMRIEGAGYTLVPFDVPTDWSAAAFMYQMAAMSRGARIVLGDLSFHSHQGDEAVAHHLQPWVETEEWHDVDLPDTINGFTILHRALRKLAKEEKPVDLAYGPDLFPALAITHAALGNTMRFSGTDNLHVKESDRLAGVGDALRQLGIPFEVGQGYFVVRSTMEHVTALRDKSFTFDPRGDHRMAMALAPLALVCESVTILDPDVVNKSYPGFWEEMEKAGFRMERGE